MLRRVLALAAVAGLFIGFGCSGGNSPTMPDKASQTSLEDFFNSYDLSSPVVARYTYTDNNGNVMASGSLGRNEDGLYVIESRGAQDIPLVPVGIIIAIVTYNNPAGTIQTGPNSGLPYYYINQTMDYDINLISLMNSPIGGVFNPLDPFSWSGPAQLTAEQHYASFDPFGVIIAGSPLPGAYAFNWTGIIGTGYTVLNDQFTIVPGTIPGLDVTTVEIHAPWFLGIFDVYFFDGVAGIWDPIE